MTKRFGILRWKVLAVFFTVLFIFCFLSIDYSDGRETFIGGYWLCRNIIQGNTHNIFVQYTYGFFIYLLIAIWCIPIVLLDIFSKVSPTMSHWDLDTPHILYYKFFLLLFVGLCLYYVYRILREMQNSKVEKDFVLSESVWGVMFLITSPCFFYFPFTITQCDIVSLTFMVMSIYYIVFKNNRLAFAILMAFSVSIKYITLFAYIPLLIFLFIKDIKTLVKVCVPSAMLLGATAYVDYYAWYVIEKVHTRTDLAYSSASGVIHNIDFLIAYSVILLMVLLYSIRNEESEKRATVYKISYIVAISLLCLFYFYRVQFYWLILVEPFLLFLLLYAKKWNYVFLQEFFMVFLIASWCVKSDRYVLGNMPFSFSIFKDYKLLWGDSGIIRFVEILLYKLEMQRETMVSILYYASAAIIVYLLYMLYPKTNEEIAKKGVGISIERNSGLYQYLSVLLHVMLCSAGLICEFIGRYIMYYK